MAATNFTPIQLYFSTTASAVPLAANLAQGELAININDGKLYYEDSTGVVQVIATKGAGTIGGSTTQIQYNNAGALAGNAAMVFNNSTNVTTLTTLNLTNALGAIYGGTAQSTYTQGDVLYSSAANTLAKLSIGAVNYILASTGSVPQWVAPSSVAVLTATNLAGGLAGSVPYQSALDTTTFLAIGAANRVMTSTGTAPQWVTALTGLTGVSTTTLTTSSTFTLGGTIAGGGNQINNVVIGTTTPLAGAFTTLSNTGLFTNFTGTAKTVSAGSNVRLFQTNEAVNYAALQGSFVGAATAADRVFRFQTVEQGVANDGIISFQPDGGNLGIGTTSPQRKFSIQNGGPAVEIDPAGISSTDPIYFNYNRTTNVYLTPQYWALAHVWNVSGGTEGMRLDDSGRLKTRNTIGVGNATPSASGAGITFPATQSASTDANTLDDYEEGTWSAATITGANVTGTSFSEGRYTKIGNIVHVQGKFTLTVTTANTLTYALMALPFTPLFTAAGSLIDNVSLVAGTAQAASNGSAYAFFAASASLPSGATDWYVSYEYQV
jgi:hypothetical protein